MKITKYRHTGVLPDGVVKGGGAVHTEQMIRMSPKNGGCGISTCHCSDGHWISIGLGRTEDGIVEGITVRFDNQKEMNKFLKERFLIGK